MTWIDKNWILYICCTHKILFTTEKKCRNDLACLLIMKIVVCTPPRHEILEIVM